MIATGAVSLDKYVKKGIVTEKDVEDIHAFIEARNNKKDL